MKGSFLLKDRIVVLLTRIFAMFFFFLDYIFFGLEGIAKFLSLILALRTYKVVIVHW